MTPVLGCVDSHVADSAAALIRALALTSSQRPPQASRAVVERLPTSAALTRLHCCFR